METTILPIVPTLTVEVKEIQYDDFVKVDLRVGTVTACEPHPNADKLLVLTVDLGEQTPRTICAGLKEHTAPNELVGKQIIVVANLAPRKMRGIVSQGMLLAATGSDGKVITIAPSSEVYAGAGVK